MKKLGFLCFAVLVIAGSGAAAQKKSPPKADEKVFLGTISDSMCGAKHTMGGTPKECTLECVDGGSSFVLVDDKGKVYDLSDQTKPRPFAGEKVKVTGTLKGNEIAVSSIDAGK